MATMYLVFASLTAAQNASKTDWVVRILKHPVASNAGTQFLWGIISNSAGTIGVITENIPMSGLSASEQASLVDETDPTVTAVLAQQAAQSPLMH
jgi:hypothetical protein